jgi:hypothetical protein
VNFYNCRRVFNALIEKYPARGSDAKTIAHWLGPDASIIHDKCFESAVEKIHSGGSYSNLSATEKRSLSVFLCDKPSAPRTREPDVVGPVDIVTMVQMLKLS